MSKMSKVKGYYDSGLWTVAMVANAVTKNWITAEEYLEITGDAYTASATQPDADGPVQLTQSEYKSLVNQITDLQEALTDIYEGLLG